jgi:hypothetical protein
MAKGFNSKDPVTGLAVTQTAKDMQKKSVDVILSTGVRARIKTVAASLIDTVNSKIPEPEVPMEFNKDKERDEPNPLSPAYLKEMRKYTKMRGEAAIETMIMFGIELIDPIPDMNLWMPKLKFLEKRGHLDLSQYDLSDPIELEYLYKANIAVGKQDFSLIMSKAGIPTEALRQAEATFPGDERPSADTGSVPEGPTES